MSCWLIFGAAKGTGALLLQRAINSGQPAIAFVRSEEDVLRLEGQGIRVIKGDACDEAAVEKACQAAGQDAVIISTIGGRHDYLAHRTIIDCAEKSAIKRMVMVTSLGCGDSWPTLSDRAKAAFGQAVREKSLADTGPWASAYRRATSAYEARRAASSPASIAATRSVELPGSPCALRSKCSLPRRGPLTMAPSR